MARTKIVLFKSNIRRDGSCPVCLRVAKEDKTKYIDLQLSATKGQWDELASRFKKDKRVNPNYENYNALLNRYEVRKDEILQKFMEERVNWTLNQFEEEFLGMSKQGKVYDYFMRQVENLKPQGISVMQKSMSVLCICWQSMTTRLRNGCFPSWM